MTDEELVNVLRNKVGVSDYSHIAANLAADRIEALVREREAIRDAALREAAEALSNLADDAVTELAYEHAQACCEEILALIGETEWPMKNWRKQNDNILDRDDYHLRCRGLRRDVYRLTIQRPTDLRQSHQHHARTDGSTGACGYDDPMQEIRSHLHIPKTQS